jgi:hypothetical protein
MPVENYLLETGESGQLLIMKSVAKKEKTLYLT